ncbi:MAG: cytochrome c biogenesis protein CcsA [Mariniblastus sp.]|nr:cytochrome c biogenesis protein CcsA [Mariniblastus sp.]
MATTPVQHPATPLGHSAKVDRLTAGAALKTVLGPLASLRLTVALLGISVFVVWLITLDQARLDIWDVKQKHFESTLVYVPFQTLLPPSWFPSTQNVPGGFYVPSGFTLLIALLVNLCAAHLLRFRLQARGWRLGGGLLVGLVAVVLTWAVVFAGRGVGGFQDQPPISYQAMWNILQFVALGLAVAALVTLFALKPERQVERILLGLFALTVGSIVIYTFWKGQESFIGNSGMRILWQLVQSTLAATVALVACGMLFNRKAGIVLLHLGVAGLLLNEVYVTVTNVEQRMLLFEGDNIAHTIDVRSSELAIIDRSDPQEDVIHVIPADMLVAGARIDDPRLPFMIVPVDYFPNSQLVSLDGPNTGSATSNQATAGFGTQWIATPQRASTGTDTDQEVDEAAAYVRLIDRDTGDPIGTYLVAHRAYDAGIADRVQLGDKEFLLGLRLKHVYKPYSVTLTDVQTRNYLGTDIPEWFSSDILIMDQQHPGPANRQKVWMNNPLRYGDETFYQSGYNQLEDGREYTVLQIVKNRGWMIPYVCCMFVVVGLFAQFSSSLLNYLKKNQRRAQGQILTAVSGATEVDDLVEKPARSKSEKKKRRENLRDYTPPPRQPGWFRLNGLALILTLIMLAWLGSSLMRSSSPEVSRGDLRLDLLGQVPLTNGGRVQPLESLARNTARRLSNRETVVDGKGDKQPAIRWLADLVFEAPGYEDYQIIRIEDRNVKNALNLPERKGFKYTLGELQEASSTMVELLPNPSQTPPEMWTVMQKRLMEVYNKFELLRGIQTSIADPVNRKSIEDPVVRLQLADLLAKTDGLPLIVPTGEEQEPWISLSTARNRQWLVGLAEKYDEWEPDRLARKMIKQELVKQQSIRQMLDDPQAFQAISQALGLQDPQEIQNRLLENWDEIPAELLRLEESEKFVDMILANNPTGMIQPFAQMIRRVNGLEKEKIEGVSGDQYPVLEKLEPLYNGSQPVEFNELLAGYMQDLTAEAEEGSGPVGWSPSRNRIELAYDYFSPFFVSTFLYLVGFILSVAAWIGFNRPFNRAAFCMICLGLLVQVGGIYARVLISGRPPVTNLYSSFVFVSAGSVLLLLVVEWMTRMGIGNVIASLAGTAQLMWAWTLSIDSGDTFTVLRAVLDTQFWLSTHVICISMGYIATLVAGLIGMGFILGGLLTPALNAERRKLICGVIYGVTCFAIFFSFFGTVLGGLWADDSWGRFWGWDPKENGALMIVLWNAVVLHARWGGLVRQKGLAGLAAFGNVVTLWSWEGVNRLGVGLHAYGGVNSGESAGSILSDPVFWMQLFIAVNVIVCAMAMVPERFWNFQDSKNGKGSLKTS